MINFLKMSLFIIDSITRVSTSPKNLPVSPLFSSEIKMKPLLSGLSSFEVRIKVFRIEIKVNSKFELEVSKFLG